MREPIGLLASADAAALSRGEREHDHLKMRGKARAPADRISDTALLGGRISLQAPTIRGFVPCRFSDAGPGARGTICDGPASENLHKTGCEQSRKKAPYLITSSTSDRRSMP